MGVKMINIFEAEPGMVLSKPIVVLHKDGRELMQPGFMLEATHIKRLKQWNIEKIYIQTYDGNESETEVFSAPLRLLAKQTYEDAINSLARMYRSLNSDGNCDLTRITSAITQILEVISMDQGLMILLSKIKEHEEYIYKHSVDVCVTAMILGRAKNLGGDELYDLGIACLLHDIGLSAIQREKWDDSLINRDSEPVRKHPIRSRDMASNIMGITHPIMEIIAQHHEYVDGSGYPEGLKSDQVNPLSLIASISEAYCHLVSPYRMDNRVDAHQALSLIVDPQHMRFDPDIQRVLISNLSVYPAGTFVELNNSMRGVVIATNRDNPLRPRVLIIYESENNPVKPFLVDLADISYKEWFVDKVLSSSSVMRNIEQIVKI